MKIGIDFSAVPGDGGKYYYSVDFVRALKRLHETDYQFVLFHNKKSHLKADQIIEEAGWKAVPYPSCYDGNLSTVVKRIFRVLCGRVCQRFKEHNLRRIIHSERLTQLYHTHGIDLILCPCNAGPLITTDIPGVFCVHDLQHRIWPEFPEVANPKIRNIREAYYLNGIERAVAVVVPSEIGKEDVVILYNKSPEDIFVLPYLVPGHLDPGIDKHIVANTEDRLGIPEKYLFYPACYWPHKNHVRVVQAIALLKKEKGLEIPVVFVGPDKREYGVGKKIEKAIKEANISELVHQMGFVSNDDMSALYSGAVALIMPSFFGPTNIPFLEAFKMSCPVITSDLRGIRDQVGKAACLVNPKSVESIADGIQRVWLDKAYRLELIENGHQILNEWTIEDFAKRLSEVLHVCERKVMKAKRE